MNAAKMLSAFKERTEMCLDGLSHLAAVVAAAAAQPQQPVLIAFGLAAAEAAEVAAEVPEVAVLVLKTSNSNIIKL